MPLSGTTLKWIAVISMLIDHTAEVLINHNAALTDPIWAQIYVLMRGIGRIAFFLACCFRNQNYNNGRVYFFHYIHYNFLLYKLSLRVHLIPVKKYLVRMLTFAVVSEIPFDLAVFHTPFYWGYQNVFFALFLGLLALAGENVVHQSSGMFAGAGLWKQAFVLILCVGTAQLINCDYGAFGVFFIILLYMTRYDKKTQTVLGAISLIWELPGILAFIPIRLYNGTRGRCGNRYFFYAFYPAHLLALWVVGRFIFKLF